jgi:hypothetical protein
MISKREGDEWFDEVDTIIRGYLEPKVTIPVIEG